MLSDNSAKINVENEVDFETVTKKLTDNGYLCHSYETKQNQPKPSKINQSKSWFNKLYHIASKESILQEVGVIPELKYKTKQTLNMFMLVFRNNENVNKIFEYKGWNTTTKKN